MIIRKMVVVLFMGTNYFTDEQLRLLEENPYVVKASKKV
jgi:transposase